MSGELSDFKDLVEEFKKGGPFVDKTQLIKEILASRRAPILITRPRRWGKSINLSMLKCWFVSRDQLRAQKKSENYIKEMDEIFNGLNILNPKINSDVDEIKTEMGKYPTIYISFYRSHINDRSDTSKIKEFLIEVISNLFSKFNYLEDYLMNRVEENVRTQSQKITEELNYLRSCGYSEYRLKEAEIRMEDDLSMKKINGQNTLDYNMFCRIKKKNLEYDDLSKSINFLAKLLYECHGQRVVILIDEYDSCFNNYYDNPAALNELSENFSRIFSPFTKPDQWDCDQIRKVIFTGILRIAKADIFSGMNNVLECNVLDPIFAKYYGFTEEEVASLLESPEKKGLIPDIKKWYNGYIIGKEIIYNPWSVMRAIHSNCATKPYWSETADTDIIQKIILENKGHITNRRLRDIISNGTSKIMELNVNRLFSREYLRDPDKIFSFLLQTGYLTGESKKIDNGKDGYVCKVGIPNLEILNKFTSVIIQFMSLNYGIRDLVKNLIEKNYEEFACDVESILKNNYDSPLFSREKNSVEEVYHSILLSEMNKNLTRDKFALLPEEKSGDGRADIIFVDYDKKTIIAIELKRSTPRESLEAKAKEALDQAINKKYADHKDYKEFEKHSIGISLCGFDLAMRVQGLNYSIIKESKKRPYSVLSKERGQSDDESGNLEMTKKLKTHHISLIKPIISNPNFSKQNNIKLSLDHKTIEDEKHIEEKILETKITDEELDSNSYKDLSEEALKHGYRIFDDLRDINSLFNAVTHQMNLLKRDMHPEQLEMMTSEAVDLEESEKSLDENKNNIVRNQFNGNWSLLNCISRAVDISIVIIVSDGKVPTIIKNGTQTQFIILGYVSGDRFTSLVALDGEKAKLNQELLTKYFQSI